MRRPPRRAVLPGWHLKSVALLTGGLVAVLVGYAAAGGSLAVLVHWPAALVVFGGTAGAVLLTYRPCDVVAAGRAVLQTFAPVGDDASATATRMVLLAGRAYRRGVLSLEPDIERTEDSFLREGLMLVVDNVPLATLRGIVEAARARRDELDEVPARVLEEAAGYAPTFGLLGAVLGLIHALRHLTSPEALGPGIASAFVATVYSVAAANLVFLPLAGRLRARAAEAARRRAVIAEALYAVSERLHPRLVAQRLSAMTSEPRQPVRTAGPTERTTSAGLSQASA
jgi:chemotaxis protein MotA